MKGKGKICRIDDWDKPEAVKCKSWSHQERLCDLKDGVSYPGLASDGDCIYIFENRNLQVYDIKTNTMRIYELAALDLESAGLFYWKNTLYIVGGCTRRGIYVAPHKGVIAVDVSQINPQ